MDNTGIAHFFRLIFQHKQTVEDDKNIQFRKDAGIEEPLFKQSTELKKLVSVENQLEHFVDISAVGNKCPSIAELTNKGYAEIDIGTNKQSCPDYKVYKNNETGEIVQIYNNYNKLGDVRYDYENEDFLHSVIYDKNGKEVRGQIQLRLNCGLLRTTTYDMWGKERDIIDCIDIPNYGYFVPNDYLY